MWRTVLLYLEEGPIWRTILLYACIPTFALYFYLFFKLISTLDEQQREIYTKKAGSYGSLVITIILFVLFFFLNIVILRLLIGMGILGHLLWSTRRHIQKLKDLGFSPTFIKQLTITACLSGLGLLMFFSAMIL